MGAWGSGIFEHDIALDCAGDTIDGFVESIDEWFSYGRENPEDYFHVFEGNIGPLISMLTSICETTHACPPGLSKVKEWKNEFIKKFDILASKEWDIEKVSIRRNMFLKSFDELIEISMKFDDS